MTERPTSIPPHPLVGVGNASMRWDMIACCAAMLLPVAGLVFSGGSFAGLRENTSLFVPLTFCLVMHILMGRPCHGASARLREAVATEVEKRTPTELSRAAA